MRLTCNFGLGKISLREPVTLEAREVTGASSQVFGFQDWEITPENYGKVTGKGICLPRV